jgi:hypothetical protein
MYQCNNLQHCYWKSEQNSNILEIKNDGKVANEVKLV